MRSQPRARSLDATSYRATPFVIGLAQVSPKCFSRAIPILSVTWEELTRRLGTPPAQALLQEFVVLPAIGCGPDCEATG